jgi:hypothetical protein
MAYTARVSLQLFFSLLLHFREEKIKEGEKANKEPLPIERSVREGTGGQSRLVPEDESF